MVLTLSWALTAFTLVGANAQTAVTSRSGRITAMNCAGEFFPIQTNLVVPLKGWKAANLGASRKATITGIPVEVRSLRAIRTSQNEGFQELAAVQPRRGTVELELAPQSLLTLTTMR